MPKALFIAEKPSVAREFAAALKEKMTRNEGWLESENYVVTWCVGHLVTMSYPEVYDPALKKWSYETLPFIPDNFLYELIPSAKKQYAVVAKQMKRKDVDTIYVCTDSGREGEYIYRLVAQMAKVKGKTEKRVWIDSQTEEEILRGIREAKPLSEYDNLASSAYLRAIEDYLMGINFSRALSVKYARSLNSFLGGKYQPVSVGRVMTCVLGMAVRRERAIRSFVKEPYFRVVGTFGRENASLEGEWKAVKGSRYEDSPLLYKENGFKKRESAEELIRSLSEPEMLPAKVLSVSKKKEVKNPPLLYNLAELQNDCSKMFRISPDQTLKIVQELYEKKLVTYPRTDARVLSSAVAKEIRRNISGLQDYEPLSAFASEIVEKNMDTGIGNSRYTNDKLITDHYAIIPTGQGLKALNSLTGVSPAVYQLIARRFLSIFYPPSVYEKVSLELLVDTEHFFASARRLVQEGYLKLAYRKKTEEEPQKEEENGDPSDNENDEKQDEALYALLASLKKNDMLDTKGYAIKESETSPPKRYTSGSMILAMENAGQLIEDEELRALIKGSGIGTSATRAEILKKLFTIKYLNLNKKTQVITPTQMGEMVFEVVQASITSLLNPELTASWEKGLSYVAEGSVVYDEYMKKLSDYVTRQVQKVKDLNNQAQLTRAFERDAAYYRKPAYRKSSGTAKEAGEN